MTEKQLKLSPATIKALASAITGNLPDIGVYRSGPMLVEFFNWLGWNDSYGSGFPTRYYYVLEKLEEISRGSTPATFIDMFKQLLDPRDYIDNEDKLDRMVEYLNKYLKYDGYEIRKFGECYDIRKVEVSSAPAQSFLEIIDKLSFSRVDDDFSKALREAEDDPSGALTSASATLESLAKAILDELGKPYPKDQSIYPLIKAVAKELNLAVEQHAEGEIRRLLGSLMGVTAGIGAIRTGYGDAHGKGMKQVKLKPMHARLAVNAASTVGLFLLETYLQGKGSS